MNAPRAAEPEAVRRRRLHMRAMRRGIREMDLILSGYAARRLERMTAQELDAFEALLEENDHDLYAWVAGQAAPPERHAPLIQAIARSLGRAE